MARTAGFPVLFTVLLTALFASSCATAPSGDKAASAESGGNAAPVESGGKAASAESSEKAVSTEGAAAGSRQPVKPNFQPTGTSVTKGLQIVSSPDNAEVYLNGVYQGRTPLVVAGIDKGTYHLEIRKDGYYEITAWIDFPGDYMLFQTPLAEITGFLQLTVSPPDSMVTVGGKTVVPGLIELPVGSHQVVVRAFGYGEDRERVTIQPRTVASLAVALSPVPFSFSRVMAAKSRVNPEDPGILGMFALTYDVTGPGSGEVTVEDSQSHTVFHEALPDFTTWSYNYLWNLRDSSGSDLADGEYRFIVSGRGRESDSSDTREITFRIDRGVRESIRSNWSGSSGLLYAPSTDVLPAGSYQISFLGAVGLVGSSFMSPIQLSLRIGIADVLELDAEAAFVLSQASSPFSLGVAARYPILRSASPYGFGLSVEAKAAAQVDPAVGVYTTDAFSNFTGISIGLPLQAAFGPLNLLADLGVIASLWRPNDIGIPPAQEFSSWIYVRGGLLLDFGPVTGGLSIAARTMPLPDGLFTIGLPFQAGIEAHLLVPGTHMVISLAALLQFSDPSSYSLSGGGGLGFIY